MPYCRSILLGLLLLSLMFFVGRSGFDSNQVANSIGTDSWLRFLTLQNLIDGNGWYHHLIERTNWPHGLEHHWTRPVDILLLPLRIIFSPMIAATAYQFLLLMAFVWGMVKTAQHYGASISNIVLLAFILAIYTNPYLLAYFSPARIDHHALLATLFVWLLYSLAKERFAVAGIFAGIGVWVAVEFFIPLTFISLWLGLCWWRDPEEHQDSPQHFFLPMMGVTTLAILLERPLDKFTTVIIDSISFPHFVLILMCSLAAIILSLPAVWECGKIWRFLKAALYGTVIFLITFAAFPQLLQLGFLNMSDPLLLEYFSQHVDELQSPLEGKYGLSPFVPLLLALPLGLWRLQRENWPLLPLMLVFTCVGMHFLYFTAFRWAYYALPAALLLFSYGLSDEGWNKRPVLRMLLILILITLPLGLIYHKKEEKKLALNHHCYSQTSQLIRQNLLGDTPLTVAISPSRGYEVLFYTPHRILAANNHRNESGLGDILRVLNTNDATVAKQIVKDRHIEVIAACVSAINKDSYLHNAPTWLQSRSLGETLEPLKIWEVKFPE